MLCSDKITETHMCTKHAHKATAIHTLTHTYTDNIHQSTIHYAWTFLPKGLCWHSLFQRTIAFELPKALRVRCDRFTRAHKNTRAQTIKHTRAHISLRPLKEVPTLSPKPSPSITVPKTAWQNIPEGVL